ncbi:MAG TPA: hypothetical protein VGI32_01810 [Steroidobacteraceae bacterium]
MNGRHSSIVAAIGLVISAPVFAEDQKSPAYTPRELAHCMMKRLRANTAESYRGAFKACKEQFETARSDRPTDAAMTVAKLPENTKE